MKKYLFLHIMLLLPALVHAYTAEINGICYSLDSSTKVATVISGSQQYSGDVNIPKQIYHRNIRYSVQSIANLAFDGCNNLIAITIPESVTSIGNGAFRNCSGLTSAIMTNGVITIDENAFDGCTSLTSIIIPESVTTIGRYAFRGCGSLMSATINGNGVTSIGDFSFQGCTNLMSVIIGDGVSSIGNYTFANCSELTSVLIGKKVTLIGSYAFYGCIGLTSVTIPNSVTSIADYAFSGCSRLTSMMIGNGVTSIGSAAFSNCIKLTSVTIPECVTSIGDKAFSGCSGMASVVIGNNVTSIGKYAFEGCNSLTSLIIPNNVTTIGFDAFSGCSGLKAVTIGQSVISMAYSAFNECNNLTSVTFLCPTIDIWFRGNTSIKEIVLGNKVKSVVMLAFSGCSALNLITIHCPTVGNWFNGLTSIKEIVLGNDVLVIGNGAFKNCSGLTSVTMGNIISIDDWAFCDCHNLTSVTIPNSVSSIGKSAFQGCSGLTSLTIPKSVTSIGEYAFSDCSNLNELTIEDGTKTLAFSTNVASAPFFQCPIENIYLGRNITYNSIYSPFWFNSSLTNLTIGNSVTSLDTSAFSRCNELTAIKFLCPHVHSWFSKNTSIKEIIFGNSVISINNNAFQDCLNLTSATISNSITSIGNDAFAGCDKLQMKVLATTPPKLSGTILPFFTPVEVPVGSGCKYAKAEYWNDIETLYSVKENTKFYPVPITVFGESILSVNEKVDFGDGFEMEEGQTVDLSVLSEDIKNSLVLKGTSDISTTLVNDYTYSYIVSPLHHKNRIETHAYPTTTIELTESGTLINQIGVDNIEKIESLKVKGNVNGTDILTIRKMTNLKRLDLGEATIVGGGMSYYETYTTSFNTIGDFFFKDKTNLASVILPANITTIKQRAFEGMTNLKSIIIPATVTNIASDAFAGCTGLEGMHIDVAGTTLTMDSKIFTDCPIRTLFLGRSLSSNPFRGKNTLTEVTIGNGVTNLPLLCFEGCSRLSMVTLPLTLTEIGAGAFEGCTSLNEVHISDLKFWCGIHFVNEKSNPCYYAHSLWLNGKEIKDLTFPINVNIIDNYAFIGCSHLTSVTIPNNVTSIGNSAFSGCSDLTSVTIGNNVTSIGVTAFAECSSLNSLTIGNSVTSIGNDAFKNCNSLTSVKMLCPTIDKWLSGMTSIKEIVLGNSVQAIESAAFSGCRGLTSVILGNSITSVGNKAFDDCSALTSVKVSDIVAWCKIVFDGVEANPLYYAHHLILNGKEVKDLVLPSSVSDIKDYAFYGGSGLTSVTIPESVTSISNTSFTDCDNVEAISLFCSNVGNWFSDKKNIKKIVLGDQIASIGEAFAGCTAVTEVHSLNPIPPEIVKNTFATEAYENATLYVPFGCATNYWLHPFWEDFSPIKEEDIPTGIDSLLEDEPHALQENDNIDVIFTLDGRRIQQDKSKLPQGIYIINGKKVYIK